MHDNLVELFLQKNTGELIADSLPVAIYVTDPEGRLQYYNSAAAGLLGREPELGTDKWYLSRKLYHSDGSPMAYDECPMAVSLREERVIDGVEALAERPDGKRFWFKAYSSPLHDKEGEIIGALNMLMNITDQIEREKQLRQAKEELADFFDNAVVGLHVTKADGIVKRANQAILDILGYDHEEFVGKHIADFYDDQDIYEDIRQKILAGEELSDYEAPMKAKDGSVRHILLSSNGYREDGEFVHTRCITRDITPRKQAKAELRTVTAKSERQERLYEAILSSTTDLVYVFDLSYRFLFANDALLEVWGLTREESIGRRLHEVGHELWHAEMHEREIDQVVATKEPVQGEVSFPHAKLGRRFYHYIFVPVFNDNGHVEAVAGTTRDVTNRIQAKQALRESEEKYRTLFETMDEGFCIIKVIFDNNTPVDFRYLETNPAFEKHTGLKGIEGKKLNEVLSNFGERWIKKYGNVVLTGEPVHEEVYAGELTRWLDISVFRVGEREEQKVAVLFKDITERKQAQQKLRKNRDRLRAALRIDTVGVLFWDSDSMTIKEANDAFLDMSGFTREEAEGKNWQELTPEEFYPLSKQAVTDIKKTGYAKPYEKQYIRKDGSRWWALFAPRRIDENEIVEFVLDISERHQAREELKDMNETLEERVEERTEKLLSYQVQLRSLASQLSKAEENQRQQLATELHDNLGQLLALGKMKVDLLQNTVDSAGSSKAITDLQEVLDGALRYTRELMSELKPPPSISGDILAAMEWIAEKLAKRGLSVIIDDDEQPKPLDEEVRITVLQSVRELLFNVVKHTSEKEAVVQLRRNEDQLRITVKDEGEGFDPDHTEWTPEKNGSFGLFNVLERIDLLGGRVDIKARKGKGTKINLYIPLSEEAKSAESVEPAHEVGQVNRTNRLQNEYGQRIKVLLVDDHKMVRKGLRKIIEDQNDVIIAGEAGDGEEAISLSRETAPDIILMDVNMPKMDGIEATRIITSEMPDIRIIGLSLHDEKRIIENMRSAGASAYLTKTEAFESLIVTIRAEASARKE